MRFTSPSPVTRLAVGLVVGAIALTACGDGDDAVTSPPANELPTDPQDGAAGGTRPADQEFTTQERVDLLLGTTQEEAENVALEFGWTVRVGRIDDEQFALTEDYQLDRMTLELDSDASGTPVVTSVTVELDGGPQTFTA